MWHKKSVWWMLGGLGGSAGCTNIRINPGAAAEALSAVCGSEGNEVHASGVISCYAPRLFMVLEGEKGRGFDEF
ncbi:hypothetical protein QUB56_14830 [Microcoleus sp. AR_TQ3_B6]|uniref:hypothetical protein n=1 Tax=Microcoleus sp. AR_TQ3_B6 TaxID=3055284 RepID=UPI002FD17434